MRSAPTVDPTKRHANTTAQRARRSNIERSLQRNCRECPTLTHRMPARQTSLDSIRASDHELTRVSDLRARGQSPLATSRHSDPVGSGTRELGHVRIPFDVELIKLGFGADQCAQQTPTPCRKSISPHTDSPADSNSESAASNCRSAMILVDSNSPPPGPVVSRLRFGVTSPPFVRANAATNSRLSSEGERNPTSERRSAP